MNAKELEKRHKLSDNLYSRQTHKRNPQLNFDNINTYKEKSMTPLKLLRMIDWYTSKILLNKRYIKRKVRNFEMFLDTKVSGISKTLAVYRNREEDMSELITRILTPGMTVIDCGSNIGYYPLLEASKVGSTGKIICIEPDPRNYELLKKNLHQSPYSSIFTPFHMAISSSEGEVLLGITEYSNLNKVVKDNSKNNNTHRIKSNSISNLLSEYGWEPDLLRMDIEGHEVDVFKGMRSSIDQFKSGFTIFLEVHPNEYSKENDFEEELRYFLNHGFYCRYLVSAGVPMPAAYAKLGYRPSEIIHSDGVQRGVYHNIENIEHVIHLACSMPKSSRYIMITKR